MKKAADVGRVKRKYTRRVKPEPEKPIEPTFDTVEQAITEAQKAKPELSKRDALILICQSYLDARNAKAAEVLK